MERALGRATRPKGWKEGAIPRIAMSLVIAATLGPLAVANAVAAFGRTTSAPGGGLAAGTVYLSSDAAGRAMLSVPNAGPGRAATSYTTIFYEGSLPVGVRLYATTSGTGLARFLRVTVTRGTGEGSAFVPDSLDRAGAGPGVVYRGTLAEFPSDWASGVVDPETWTRGESHSYRFVVRLADDASAQGLTAGASFRWEARNV